MGFLTHALVSFLIVQTLTFAFRVDPTPMEKNAEPADSPVHVTSCTAPSKPSSYSSQTDFNNQALAWHNYLRCLHGAPDMSLNTGLTAAAKAWADKMAAGTVGFEHSVRCGDGENIAKLYGSSAPAWKGVLGEYITYNNYGYIGCWYCGECSAFNWNTYSYQSSSGHFTQIIWKDSIELGCAAANDGTYTYIVCQYSPAGNMVGTNTCWSNDVAIQDISGTTYATLCPTP